MMLLRFVLSGVFLASPVLAGNNDLFVRQVGEQQIGRVLQQGSANQAYLLQGTDETALTEALRAIDRVDPDLVGLSGHSVGNNSALIQRGSDNRAVAVQVGSGNIMLTEQTGHANTALHAQIGNGNQSELIQRGNGNDATLRLIGDHNRQSLTVRGDGLQGIELTVRGSGVDGGNIVINR